MKNPSNGKARLSQVHAPSHPSLVDSPAQEASPAVRQPASAPPNGEVKSVDARDAEIQSLRAQLHRSNEERAALARLVVEHFKGLDFVLNASDNLLNASRGILMKTDAANRRRETEEN